MRNNSFFTYVTKQGEPLTAVEQMQWFSILQSKYRPSVYCFAVGIIIS